MWLGCLVVLVGLVQGSLQVVVLGRGCISGANVCNIEHSYCDNGVCACERLTHVASLNKTMCLPVVRTLRGRCEEDQQCMNNVLGQDTMCINRECICRYGATDMSRPCDLRKNLDDWCDHNQQCQNIDHASCVQGRCACDPYFVPLPHSRTKCIPVATRLGVPCQEQVQCTAAFGEGGFCDKDGRCRCLGQNHFVLNLTVACVRSRGLTESCKVSNECWLPLDGGQMFTECVGGVCVCRSGLKPTADKQGCSGAWNLHDIFSVSKLLAIALLTTSLLTAQQASCLTRELSRVAEWHLWSMTFAIFSILYCIAT